MVEYKRQVTMLCSKLFSLNQAFKYLEDRDSSDGSDSLYGCVWDMAILEFAMSLHTKRGEVARRQQALNCIMQVVLFNCISSG